MLNTTQGKPPIERVIEATGQGFLAKTMMAVIRKILNDAIRPVKPGQLLKAIQEDTSIWNAAGADIKGLAEKIPPTAIAMGKPYYQKAVKDYGSATELVLAWLREDNPGLFSLIINTPGGVAWFDRQVQEMTMNLGLE